MPVSLADGSVVGDGSQIGMLPVLADQRLDKPATLLRSSANPRMDLVLLLLKDAAAQSAPTATAPPGMSAAQFALVQRMLAARQRGAQASIAQGAPEPKRGPQINLVLWRMGDDSSAVWSTPLDFNRVMDLPPNSAGASQQEHEDVHLHDIAWSPKGDRVAVLTSVKRSPVASTSTASWRATTFLRTYSVQDGRLLSTLPVCSADHTTTSDNVDQFSQPMTATWLDVDFGVANDDIDGSSESILTKFSPLPVLPAADTFASAGGTGNLMPHQLRMMQMSGQKPPPSFQFPSHLALQGRGPLAGIPHLAKANTDLRLLEGGDAALALDQDRALPLLPETVVLVSRAASAHANLVLDGHINIGSVQIPQTQEQAQSQHDSSACPSRTLCISPDMMRVVALSLFSNLDTSHQHLTLPLPVTTRYGPLSVRRKIAAVSRASHLLRFYLGYALDSISAVQQIYQKELVQKVTNEWTKNIDDLSIKFGGDMKYELVNVLLTGRAGPAAEQFLLGNLTEGVLTRLEQQTHTAMYALKKLISDSLKPALERSIVCLSGLLGQARFFGQDDQGLCRALKLLQASLDSTLSLAKEVDLEALISQEFYRWCRTERERQERIKQDQDEPRLPITYDVHYVAMYIDRGFANEDIHARMGDSVSEEVVGHVLAEARERVSLQEALEGARAFLAAPAVGRQKGKAQRDKEEASDSGEKQVPLAILPTVNRAVEMLGGQLSRLLDADLGQSTVEDSGSNTAAQRDWKLAREPAPALSLSSSAEVQEQAARVCTASFTSAETLFSAYILRSSSDPASSNSILVVRQDTQSSARASPAQAHFAMPAADDLSILDLGFYGDAELLVLGTLSSAVSVLLAFNLADLSFDSAGTIQAVTPTRATEFEKEFRPVKLAVNTNKQTATVLEEDGKRIMYLDVSVVEVGGGDVAMQEEG